MAEIVKGCVVLDESEVQGIVKANKFFALFVEMDKLIESMSEKELHMLEMALGATIEEMRNNGSHNLHSRENQRRSKL